MAKDRKVSRTLFGQWDFQRQNYILFGIGVLDIIVAYFIMALSGTNSFQALTLSPIMLTVAYLVIIPLSILYRPKKADGGRKQ